MTDKEKDDCIHGQAKRIMMLEAELFVNKKIIAALVSGDAADAKKLLADYKVLVAKEFDMIKP